MDVLKIYEQMHLAHVNAQNLQKFMQGYAFHNAISSQTDWSDVQRTHCLLQDLNLAV